MEPLREVYEANTKVLLEGTEKSYYIQGIFLQAAVPNRNGRIYPIEVMRKAVNQYNEQWVSKSRAVGEFGHPECFVDENCQVLTTSGFVSIKDIKVGDVVYTRNPETDELQLKPILEKIEQHYNGTIYHVTGQNIDTKVTPNHRFLVKDSRTNQIGFLTADEIKTPRKDLHKIYICKTGQSWKADYTDTFVLPPLSSDEYERLPQERHQKYQKELIFDSKVFMRFMGYFLGEGTLQDGGRVVISQKDPDVIADMEALFSCFPKEISVSHRIYDEKHLFSFSDMRVAKYLKPLGVCYTKYIPEELKNRSREELFELFDAFVLGDGRLLEEKSGRGLYWKDVFSVSERLIDDLAEVFVKLGFCANKRKKIPVDRTIVENGIVRNISAENSQPLYFLGLCFANGIYLDKRFLKIEEESHDGPVYCIKVENENFYVMDNGKSFWSGNSSSINPERVSHKIVSLEFQGDNVYGKAKVLDTEYGKTMKAFIDGGVKFGMSSRALGTLKREGKYDIVQDDLTISTIDAVLDPSASEAFVTAIFEQAKKAGNNNLLLEQVVESYKKQLSEAKQEEKKALINLKRLLGSF